MCLDGDRSHASGVIAVELEKYYSSLSAVYMRIII
jgi:hypothetical protein